MGGNSDFDTDIWTYYQLELFPDPLYKTDITTVDEVTWRTYLLQALKQLHGVFGAAIDTDIIQTEGKKCVVRIQKEDTPIFRSAVLAFTTDLSIFGYDDVRASLSLSPVNI